MAGLLLPAHFHDVTYDHIWSKILQELTKSPARNTRAILKTYFHDSLTAELRDYADLIKFLNMSKA